MAYGDLPLGAPHKPNKGHEGGACNRERCQAEPALWFNHGSFSWYCEDCSVDIGMDKVNLRDWNANWLPKVGHPMFETREEMEAREGQFAAMGPRSLGKTTDMEPPDYGVLLKHMDRGRDYFDYLKRAETVEEIERRWYPVQPNESRQVRRAREARDRKRLLP